MLNVLVLLKFYKGEIGPFDESALECALSLEDASVTLLAMAPEGAKDRLKNLTRLKNSRAILICDDKFRGSDTIATAKVLAKAVEKLNPDIVLCGRQSMDGDTAQVPSQVATLSNYNLITNALEFNLNKINTRLGEEKVNLPVVISVERIKNLRFPSLRSKCGDVEVWDNSVLGLADDEVGIDGSKTKVLKVFSKPKHERKCKFISSDELDGIIKEGLKKEKISLPITDAEKKLKEILIVGDGVLSLAKSLSDKILQTAEKSPQVIADFIREKDIKHVLFEATIENRKIAPQVSALLNSGLAADCIGVETDGENLYCYRPANADDVVAKIAFTSGVQMATVRCVKQTDDIIFSVGYGGKDYIDKVKDIAKKYSGDITSSRKLVDLGVMDYPAQVGLTGKIVTPKVYVAIGISGEVQHVVGMENSTTIIAINKDKNAKIFDYADYGVTEDIKDVKL